MKLIKGFVTQMLKDEQIMVAAGPAADIFHGVVRSNETAAFIVDCLKQETTEEAIVRKITDAYEVDDKNARSAVETVLGQLEQIHALE